MAQETNVLRSTNRSIEEEMMDREQRYGAYMGVLVGLLIGVILFLLTSCVSIDYHAAEGVEDLSVKTFLKSLDGLAAERDDEGFGIIIDKTYTNDPTRAVAELLETYRELYGMGLRYEPNVVPPLMPRTGEEP